MLTAWYYSPRPNGRPELTFGESLKLKTALKMANVVPKKWYELAQERDKWKGSIKNIGESQTQRDHPVLDRRADYTPRQSPSSPGTSSPPFPPLLLLYFLPRLAPPPLPLRPPCTHS